MATFPDFDYIESGYGWSVEPIIQRTEFSSRNTRQRLLMKTRDDLFTVSLKLTNAQLSTFETFVIDTLNNGADEFTGPYWVYDVEKTGTLQIVDGKYSVNYLTPNYWQVSYDFYVKDRDMSDELAIYNLVNEATTFANLYDIMEATEHAVNDNEL